MTPALKIWREAVIRLCALQTRYRKLCINPDVPVATIVARLQQLEKAQTRCQALCRQARAQKERHHTERPCALSCRQASAVAASRGRALP